MSVAEITNAKMPKHFNNILWISNFILGYLRLITRSMKNPKPIKFK